jgi:outer membrane protein OmpA-like peptidoglycan-associated protein
METTMKFYRRKFSKTLALAFLAIGALSQAASAESLSAQQIVDGLKTQRTRSLSATSAQPAPLSLADAAFLDRVRRTRSLSSADRDQIATIAKQRPSVDVEIYFDYNSAALTPQAEPQLNNLGKALTSQDLAGSVVMLGGHTDAKGGEDYNQGLSERRAETVKKFLVDTYHIPAQNLISAGYGKRDLKNATDPFAAENRRVQIVNMASNAQAGK